MGRGALAGGVVELAVGEEEEDVGVEGGNVGAGGAKKSAEGAEAAVVGHLQPDAPVVDRLSLIHISEPTRPY